MQKRNIIFVVPFVVMLSFLLSPYFVLASEVLGTLSNDPSGIMINQGSTSAQVVTSESVSDNSMDKEFIIKFGIILIFGVIVLALALNTFSPRWKISTSKTQLGQEA